MSLDYFVYLYLCQKIYQTVRLEQDRSWLRVSICPFDLAYSCTATDLLPCLRGVLKNDADQDQGKGEQVRLTSFRREGGKTIDEKEDLLQLERNIQL